FFARFGGEIERLQNLSCDFIVAVLGEGESHLWVGLGSLPCSGPPDRFVRKTDRIGGAPETSGVIFQRRGAMSGCCQSFRIGNSLAGPIQEFFIQLDLNAPLLRRVVNRS